MFYLRKFSFFRTIYHDGEHEDFIKKLQARIQLQDKEVEKMCHRHYQGFIDAVRELLQVRGQANAVKVISAKTLRNAVIYSYEGYLSTIYYEILSGTT